MLKHLHDLFHTARTEEIRRREFLLRAASLVSVSTAGVVAGPALRSAFAAPSQNDWAQCIYCRMLFFNGYAQNKGRCAAYGVPSKHAHVGKKGDYTKYQVTYDDSTGPGQGDWRYCRKCGVLFFNGYPEKGVCAADRGDHEAAGYNFFLYHDRRRRQDEEDGWRYCAKCHALFYSAESPTPPSTFDCPADGKLHQAAGYKFVVGRKLPTL